VLGIASILLRYFGVGVAGRLRLIMVAGIVIGLVGIVLGLVRGHTAATAVATTRASATVPRSRETLGGVRCLRPR
jgi:ABC-type lipoprotein release transport system permease subunit